MRIFICAPYLQPESERSLLLDKVWNNEQALTRIYRPAMGEDDNPEPIAEWLRLYNPFGIR